MKKIQLILSIILFSVFILTSCEDVIDVDLDNGKSQLVIDGFVNDLPENQVIRLTISTPYFNNSKANPALGASVKLIENGNKEYIFIDLESNGNYTYIYNPADSFCVIGKSYKLEIIYSGQEYNSFSKVNQVPNIDSIRSIKDKNPFTGDPEYKGEFFSVDFKGSRDFYWVRSWYNDTLNSMDNSDIISDGAFSGTGADGLTFIVPMRETINRQGDPYFPGDTIRMQLFSINEETYNFLNDVVTQLNNGGLFATPLTNVRTNIVNKNTAGEKALGWFVTSAAKTAGVRIKEEK
ncbi:MAG: DUF4249 domain-containing protein [Candidatus Kapaibacteriota bacterium]|jgi:hypothetical protein